MSETTPPRRVLDLELGALLALLGRQATPPAPAATTPCEPPGPDAANSPPDTTTVSPETPL